MNPPENMDSSTNTHRPAATSDRQRPSTDSAEPSGFTSWFQPLLLAMRPIIDPFWGRCHLMLLTHPYDFVSRNRDGLRELVRFRETFRGRGVRLVLGPSGNAGSEPGHGSLAASADNILFDPYGDAPASSHLLPRAALLIDRQGVLRASVRYSGDGPRTLDEMVRLANLITLD